ncbi:MAG: hypothetical protein LBC39_00110 [Methanobrevibacter sp.]|nr:hypothetical protein [Candidatus Methanovirga aequatorialis]
MNDDVLTLSVNVIEDLLGEFMSYCIVIKRLYIIFLMHVLHKIVLISSVFVLMVLRKELLGYRLRKP